MFWSRLFCWPYLWLNRDSTRPWNLHHHCRVWRAGASFSWTVVAVGRLVKPSVDGLSPALWFLIKDYQRARILTLFDPERDPLGSGWNIIQSTIAIGSGGLSGKGLLKGTQSHLEFLPESSTDFIIAVLAEELGFMGVLFCWDVTRCSL